MNFTFDYTQRQKIKKSGRFHFAYQPLAMRASLSSLSLKFCSGYGSSLLLVNVSLIMTNGSTFPFFNGLLDFLTRPADEMQSLRSQQVSYHFDFETACCDLFLKADPLTGVSRQFSTQISPRVAFRVVFTWIRVHSFASKYGFTQFQQIQPGQLHCPKLDTQISSKLTWHPSFGSLTWKRALWPAFRGCHIPKGRLDIEAIKLWNCTSAPWRTNNGLIWSSSVTIKGARNNDGASQTHVTVSLRAMTSLARRIQTTLTEFLDRKNPSILAVKQINRLTGKVRKEHN